VLGYHLNIMIQLGVGSKKLLKKKRSYKKFQ